MGPTIETAFKILDFGSGTLKKITVEAKATDASLKQTSKTAKEMATAAAGPKAVKDSVKGLGDQTTQTKTKVKLNMDDMKFRIAAATRDSKDRVEKLTVALDVLNKTRSNPKIDLDGGAEALAMVRILKSELNSLERSKAKGSIAELGLGALGGGRGGGGSILKGLKSGFQDVFSTGFKLVSLFTILGPMVVDFTGSLGALVGVAGGASVGAAGVGAGMLGMLGVGFAGIAAGVIPVVKGLGEGKKALEAYNKAVEKYGKNSAQAALAQKGFENTGRYGSTWQRLHQFGERWTQKTQPARNTILGTIGSAATYAEKRWMNTGAKVTNNSAQGLQKMASSFEKGIDTPGMHKGILELSNLFTKLSPTAGNILANLAKTFINISVAAKPYVIEFFKWFDKLTSGWAKGSGNIDKTTKAMKPLIGDLKSVANFLKQGGKLLGAFFGEGQGPGKGLLNDSSKQLRNWREDLEKSPGAAKDWFAKSVKETEQITKKLSPFLKDMGELADKLNLVLMPWLEMTGAIRSTVAGATGSNLTGDIAAVGGAAAAYKGAKAIGKGVIGKVFDQFEKRGSTPANPLFVADVTGGLGPGGIGKLGKAAKAGRLGKILAKGKTLLKVGGVVGAGAAGAHEVLSGSSGAETAGKQAGAADGAKDVTTRAGRKFLKGGGWKSDLLERGGPLSALAALVEMGTPGVEQNPWNLTKAGLHGADPTSFLPGGGITGWLGIKPHEKEVPRDANEWNNYLMGGTNRSLKDQVKGKHWDFGGGQHPAPKNTVYTGTTGISAAVGPKLVKRGKEVSEGKESGQKFVKAVQVAILHGNAELETASGKGWESLLKLAGKEGAAVKENWEGKMKQMRTATKEGFTGIFGELESWLKKSGAGGSVSAPSAAQRTQTAGAGLKGFHGKGATGGRTGSRVPGWGNADTQSLLGIAAPGELIVNKHTEADVNRDLVQSGKPSLAARVAGESRRHGDTYTDYKSHGVSGPITPGMQRGGRFMLGGRLGTGNEQFTGSAGNLNAMVSEANRLNSMSLPYVWGGGHAGFSRNPGGLDCSGTVSDVLHAGGLLETPMVSGSLASWGSAGPSSKLTVYANAEHTFMKLNGKYFGTSTTNPGGGPGWIPASNFSPSYLATFSARHASVIGGGKVAGGKALGAGVNPPPQLKGRTMGGTGIMSEIGNALLGKAKGKAQGKLNKEWGGAKAGKGGGKVYSGKVSWFSGGATAGGKNTADPGIAMNINPGTESGWNNPTTDKWMAMSNAGHPQNARVSIAGHSAILPIIDKGPAGFTQRAIDVTEGGVKELGFSTGAFPTDATGTAQLMAKGGRVPWFGKGGNFSVKRPTLIGVGDGGTEHVSVTNANQRLNAGRRGGRNIEVNIGTVVHQREGDLAEHIRRELELVAAEIDGGLSEDPADLMG